MIEPPTTTVSAAAAKVERDVRSLALTLQNMIGD